jgi:hypothetical protein
MEKIVSLIVVLIILCAVNISAQDYPDLKNAPPNGEVLVYAIDGIEGNSSLLVELSVNGVVYNDMGNYDIDVDMNHPDYTKYSSAALDGGAESLYAQDKHPLLPWWVSWESVYREDESADEIECPGMVGWGEYKISFTYGGHTEQLYINTIDGNWMDEASYGNSNKIAIAITVNDLGGNSYSFDLEKYDWDTDSWGSISNNDEINIWDQLGDPRNRSSINVLSGQPFKWVSTSVPILVNSITVNHNINILGEINIVANKSLKFTDDDGLPVYVKCDESSIIFVSGTLISETNIVTTGYYCVYFIPDEYPHLTRNEWRGIKVDPQDQEGVTVIILNNASISNAYIGVESTFSSHSNYGGIYIKNCKFFRCEHGIFINNARGIISNTEISGCGNGIRLRNDVYNIGGPTLITGCKIHNCTPSGITQGSLGSGVLLEFDSETIDQSVLPHERVRIDSCYIYYNWFSGIYSSTHDFALTRSSVYNNGHHYGRGYGAHLSWPSSGVEAQECHSVLRENILEDNKGSGWHVGNGQGSCTMPDEFDGNNCFIGNARQINLQHNAIVSCGVPTLTNFPEEMVLLGGRNSFINPSNKLSGGEPDHFIALSNSTLRAYANYFFPYSDPCWSHDNNSIIDVFSIITIPELVNCANQTGESGTGQTVGGDNEYLSRAQNAVLGYKSYDTTWKYTAKAFPAQLNEYETRLLTRMASSCFYYGGMDAALDSLERYAYTTPVLDDGKCTASLYELVRLNLRSMNGEDAESAVDTLKARQIGMTGAYDTLYYRLTKAKIQLRANNDTSTAVAMLELINIEQPDTSGYALRLLYYLTGDTSYVVDTVGLEKRTTISTDPSMPTHVFMSIYPNPAQTRATLLVETKEVVASSIAVYDMLGRRMYTVHEGYIEKGATYFEIGLERFSPGTYQIVIRTQDGVKKIENIIVK